MQVIERPANAIENLVQRSGLDRRHSPFEIHEDVLSETRLFSDRAMGLGELTDPALACLPDFLGESDEKVCLFKRVERLPELSRALNQAFAGSN